jgi:hypothetical protein
VLGSLVLVDVGSTATMSAAVLSVLLLDLREFLLLLWRQDVVDARLVLLVQIPHLLALLLAAE